MWGSKDVFIDATSAPSGYTDKMMVHYWGSGDSYVWASSLGSINGKNMYKASIPDGATNWQVCRGDALDGSKYNYQTGQTYSTNNKYTVTGWDNSGSGSSVIGMVKGGYIYFYNASTAWNNNIQFVIGHSSYSRTYEMTQISNTKIWYVNLTDKANHEWTDAQYYGFIGSASKYGDGSWGSSNLSTATYYLKAYTSKYSLDNGSTYWCVPSASANNSTFSITYKSGYDAIDKLTASSKVYTRTKTGNTYTLITSGTWPTTVSIQGTVLNGNGSSNRTTAGTSSGGSGSYNAVKSGLITMSYTASADWYFEGWTTAASTAANTSTSNTCQYNITAATTAYAYFTRKWQVTFEGKGTKGTSSLSATAGGVGISSGDKVKGGTEIVVTASPATGYEVEGWYSDASCTSAYTSGSGGVTISGSGNVTFTLAGSSLTAAKTIYCKFQPKTYTVTLSYSDESHYSSAPSGVNTSVIATYGSNMPTMGTKPKGAQGYGFAGYFTGHNGTGTKYYNEDASSARTWNINGATTLYAYFKRSEITSLDLTGGGTVSPGVTVTATPTISPSPDGTTTVCWRLLRSSGTVYSTDCFSSAGGNAVTFIAPASGHFKVECILREGGSCGSGTVIDSVTANLNIATDHTVTIKYVCDGEEIMARTTKEGHPLSWTSVSAPAKVGYAFSRWVAGDGVVLESAATTNSNRFKAYYDGILTATYTKKKMIFFDNTLGWSAPHVYFYKDGGYWDDSKGTGCNGDACWNKNDAKAMTRIGSTSIWYYDFSGDSWANNVTKWVGFTDGNKSNHENFNGVDVVYPTYNSYSDGYNAGTPMFVPLEKAYQGSTYFNGAPYFSKGYWVNYLGENSGYTIIIRENNAGAKEIKRQRFVPENKNFKRVTMKAKLDLDANTSYKMEILRDDGLYYKNSGFMKENNHTWWDFSSGASMGGITSTAAGTYEFTLGYGNNSDDNYKLRLTVKYPAEASDFQILYKDRATWSQGNGTAHDANWIHPSRLIKARAGGVDTISFFVAKDNTPSLKARKVNTIDAESGVISWTALNISGNASMSLSVTESAVYNFKVTQGSKGVISSIVNIGKYTGNYYVRSGALNSSWDNYTKDFDHLMTYSPFSESDDNAFGPKYSHYKAKWCPRGVRVNFCVANDYSPCISDTLWVDKTNVYWPNGPYSNIYDWNDGTRPGELKASSYDGSGNINSDETGDKYSANIRFMWNRKTNQIGRAYVASATNASRQYLVLKGCNTIKNSDGTALGATGESSAEYRAIFKDDQDFIYERMILIQPNVRAKVYACYANESASPSTAQYFAGTYNSGSCSNASTVKVIGGTGSDFQKVRVIYDFKTNRLIMAWMPTDASVGTDQDIDADVMVIRDHQEGADAITFGASGKLSDVKFVYGVMKFNRWTLNNRKRGQYGEDDQLVEHCNSADAISTYHPVLPIADQKSIYERALYFISFPFDVNLTDVFGLGDYGKHWVVSEYNGKRRAQRGYFIDTPCNEDCTNWDYIWDRKDKVLKAYEGYLLSLDLDRMEYDNDEFWVNNISQKELFFPSAEKMGSITTTSVTMPALTSDYLCTINYNIPEGSNPEGDRRMKDSYWRCIGVPSYAPYGSVLKKDGPSGATFTWQSDRSWRANEIDYPFLYEWNVDDNSLSVQSTSTYNFKPMHAYLVQNGNKIHWTNVSATPSSIVRRERRDEYIHSFNWRLTLESSTRFEDQTFVRMTNNEQVTDTFDFAQDLIKESKYAHSDIYTYIGTERVAANSMPINTETTTVVKVGLSIDADGEYTISLPDGTTHGIGIDLLDTETGERTHLSAGMSYTVNLTAGEHNERFLLEISPIPANWQGIEEPTSDPSQKENEGIRKVLIDGNLYIVRDGKMYDARGTRVR